MAQRVVALVDLDCFYCAVERRRDPSLLGLPMAVVQYNPWENAPGGPCVVGGVTSRTPEEDRRDPLSNGSLIAVSYEARACGVKRIMRGQEARRCCPELVLVQVPTAHGKASLTIYKEAGHEVVDVMCREAGVVVEKASVDEMYLDVTAAAASLLASTSWAALLAEAAESHVAGHGGEVAASCPPSAPPSRAASAAPSPLKPAAAAAAAAAAPSTTDCGGGGGGAAAPMAAADLALLPREAVRNGHAGQRSEAVPEAGRAWWRRSEAAWCSEERALAAGAVVVARLRAAVATSLPGFTCSAGVAANKMFAKLCAGLHKPDQQTVLPAEAVPALLHPLPLDRIKSLGAMFGERVMSELGVRTVGELAAVPRERLMQRFGEKSGAWLAAVAVGRDDEPVQQRALPKSMECGKNFGDHREGGGKFFTAARLRSFAQARRAAPPRVSAACHARATPTPRLRHHHSHDRRATSPRSRQVEGWLQELAAEIAERLEADLAHHARRATQFTVRRMPYTPSTSPNPEPRPQP